MNSLNRVSFCRLACPGDFSRLGVSLAGEEDPVCHGTPQTCQEGDGGEPLPVSRATSAGREGEYGHPPGGTGTLDELGHPQRPPEGLAQPQSLGYYCGQALLGLQAWLEAPEPGGEVSRGPASADPSLGCSFHGAQASLVPHFTDLGTEAQSVW